MGSSRYEPAFRSNGDRLSRFADCLRSLGDTLADRRVRVVIGASASPEGGAAMNALLCRERLRSASDALAGAGLEPELLPQAEVVLGRVGVVSEEGLAEAVRSSSIDGELKSGILEVLADSSAGYSEKIRILKEKDGGRCWKALSEDCFPDMRYFRAELVFAGSGDSAGSEPQTAAPSDSLLKIAPPASSETASGTSSDISSGASSETPSETSSTALSGASSVAADSLAVPADSSECGSVRNKILVKTNVVGLSLLMANAGAEFGLSRHISVHIPVYYSGIDYFSSRVKFRTFALQPELRWNFSGIDGLFAGVHFTLAYFNIAVGGDWRYQDRSGDTPLLGGGLSLGYRLHFAKDSRWGVEFTLGAGACAVSWDRFVNEKNGPYVDTVSGRTYWGIDNAAVSVFYEFDLGRGRRR